MYILNINNNCTPQVQYKQINFGNKNPLDLGYIIQKHSGLIPQRVLNSAKEASKLLKSPTLKEIHINVYEKLKDCKTLDEAKIMFPEFAGVLEADSVFKRLRGNIKILHETGALYDSLSLRLLKDFWSNLKTQEEIAQELGIRDYKALAWILNKINFPLWPKNYRTLLRSSDPVEHALISAKTTAWNAAHPDLMRAHNKKAAQGTKTEAYKIAQSKRKKQYYIDNPHRRHELSEHSKAVWDRLPHVKEKISDFIKTLNSYERKILAKKHDGFNLNEFETRARTTIFKKFWQTHPECLEEFRRVQKEITELKKFKTEK